VAFVYGDGKRLGEFAILREIGRGGMGIVSEARQLSLNRRVALKVLSGGLGLTPKAVQRFRREAEAAAKLLTPRTTSSPGRRVSLAARVPMSRVFRGRTSPVGLLLGTA
jgi:serine/threonine protein kinase